MATQIEPERCLALVELRKQVEVDDPLAEIEVLIKQGKHQEAMVSLQKYAQGLQAGGKKMTPQEQRRLQEMLKKIMVIQMNARGAAGGAQIFVK